MTIDTFSFRYADTAGFMEWFRYNPAQGLWIDRCDGAMQAKRCRMTEEELAELEEIIRAHKIDEWNDFCKLDLCMCSGKAGTNIFMRWDTAKHLTDLQRANVR